MVVRVLVMNWKIVSAVWCRLFGGRIFGFAAGHRFCINWIFYQLLVTYVCERLCICQQLVRRSAYTNATTEVSVSAVRRRQFCAGDSAAVAIHRDAEFHLLCHTDCQGTCVWKGMPFEGIHKWQFQILGFGFFTYNSPLFWSCSRLGVFQKGLLKENCLAEFGISIFWLARFLTVA